MIEGCVPPVVGVGGAANWVGNGAALDVEILIVSVEGGLAPINLVQPSAGGPIVGVPEGGVDSHGLRVWIGNPNCLIVLVDPDWNIVHIKPAQSNLRSK